MATYYSRKTIGEVPYRLEHASVTEYRSFPERGFSSNGPRTPTQFGECKASIFRFDFYWCWFDGGEVLSLFSLDVVHFIDHAFPRAFVCGVLGHSL